MYAKLKISADITVLTGMHIGGSDSYSAIGAVDSPVIRDELTKEPIIPGSSLKGKLRTLLARSLSDGKLLHEPNDDPEVVRNLFGASGAGKRNSAETNSNKIKRSRLQFCDAFLINKEEFENVSITEVKFENSITRSTSVANPRQIERVTRGAKFGFVVIYDIDEDANINEDISLLARAIKLLQMDYIGGNGSRGYGRVKFSNFKVDDIFGSVDKDLLDNAVNKLKEVENFELYEGSAVL